MILIYICCSQSGRFRDNLGNGNVPSSQVLGSQKVLRNPLVCHASRIEHLDTRNGVPTIWWSYDMESLSASLSPCTYNHDRWIPHKRGQWCWTLVISLLLSFVVEQAVEFIWDVSRNARIKCINGYFARHQLTNFKVRTQCCIIAWIEFRFPFKLS